MSFTSKRPVGDPKSWSTHQVKGWLLWLSNRFNLKITAEMHESFGSIDGELLMIASKDLFKILFGLVQGDIVYEDLHNMTYLHDMTDLRANTSQNFVSIKDSIKDEHFKICLDNNKASIKDLKSVNENFYKIIYKSKSTDVKWEILQPFGDFYFFPADFDYEFICKCEKATNSLFKKDSNNNLCLKKNQ